MLNVLMPIYQGMPGLSGGFFRGDSGIVHSNKNSGPMSDLNDKFPAGFLVGPPGPQGPRGFRGRPVSQ